MRAPCCLNKRATPNGATPLIAPHYALRSLLSVASIPHAARISYHWTACTVNWLNFHRTGGSTCSGQVAQATPDRRLRRTGIFIDRYCQSVESWDDMDDESLENWFIRLEDDLDRMFYMEIEEVMYDE